jgi:diguanylate cyclase (GGDEF)-like protein/PAS domain S-box-containing protein
VRLLLDSTSEAIFGVDTEGICTFANPACVRMLRYASEDDLVGKCIHELIHHTYPDGRPYPMHDCAVRIATLSGQASHRNDEVHWRADGSSFPVEFWSHPMYKDGALVGTVVAFIDISEQKQAEEELHRLAYYDSLTGLPNRVLFNDRLHQALADARRRQRLVALMLLDMDRFKVVNDTMGHEAGDNLLSEIGARLQRCIREGDTVSRLGGDEFALVFADVGAAQHVAQLAQSVLSQFEMPVIVGGREIFSGASIGIALFPEDTEDADSLLKFADSAMYHAKESGRSNYQFYSREMTASVQARLRLETDLRRALDNGELFLRYQPQVDAARNRITGVEALLRWRGPSGEVISPAEFIPLAEETGLIVPIGRWVLETACAQLRRWRDAGHVELSLSVNVASRQFRDLMFPGTVGDAVAAAGIPPQLLELELTESILLEHSDDTRRTLDALKQLGVTLAIDDFGTGYSSLSYLKRLPIDRVKIDQSFVRDLATDSDDLAIVRAIISLARAMRLGVIAEGVETVEQLATLRREDCHDYQGYLFAHPLDAGDIERMLRAPDQPV